MPEQLQKIWNQVLEWWKKFSTKQKIILGSVTGAILLALVILAMVVSTPTMVELVKCDSTEEASKIKDILVGTAPLNTKLQMMV